MKRLLTFIWTATLELSLAVCGNSQNDSSFDSDSQEQTTSQSSQTAENSKKDAFSSNEATGNADGTKSKILIAYFAEAENSEVDAVASASVVIINGETKGRIRAMADMIQAENGGELFSI